jgi:large subunit ribosomal protein L25
MKAIEIIGYKRANLGKGDAKRLRDESNVPCVLYGGEQQIHFYAPMILFRPLIYTEDAHFVNLNIEGTEYRCILQDVQYHPVSDIILHADFLELHEGKPIKMMIPVHFVCRAIWVQKGGKILVNERKLIVKALPKDMPESIEINIAKMDLGDTVKVKEVKIENFEILNSPNVTIASVNVPRVTISVEGEEEEAVEEGAEAEGGAAGEAEGETTES